jgi:hypothetical protein
MEPNAQHLQPACQIAHNLVNKLSAIIGHCELVSTKAEQGTECAKRLVLIRDLAKSAAKELTEHQDQILQSRKEELQNPVSV